MLKQGSKSQMNIFSKKNLESGDYKKKVLKYLIWFTVDFFKPEVYNQVESILESSKTCFILDLIKTYST